MRTRQYFRRDPQCLFWAAQREALDGIELSRGTTRYLATYLSMRGYRVAELTVTSSVMGNPVHDGWPNPADLLTTWWQKRRYRPLHAEEIAAFQAEESNDAHAGSHLAQNEQQPWRKSA